MILGKLQNDPARLTSLATTMIAVGLSMTVIGIAWPRHSPPMPHPGTNWSDFFRGVIFGVAFVLEIAGIVFAASAAAAKNCKAK